MGKLFHKLIQGILPSCIFTSFLKPRASSRRLPYFKLKQSISKPAASPDLPSLPSSPSIINHGPAMEIEQSTYYYSYSEDDNGNLSMAGHGETSPVSIESVESGSPHNNTSQGYMSKELQHGIHHHHHSQYLCQQYDDSPHDRQYVQHHKPCRRDGCKRKSLALDEGDDEIERNGSGNVVGNVKSKKQRRSSVSCELPKCVSEIVGRGSAIVQYSYLQEPQHAFWESMVDMIVGNGLWDASRQEALLLCYLTLNDTHLYATICASFLQALRDLHSCLATLEGACS